jgi:hypothetical protein
MRLSSSLVGLLGVSLSLVVGCASAASDDSTDESTGAATGAATKIGSGVYDGELQLVAKGTHLEGSYFSQVGDPEHGGAQCYFTISGYIENVGGVEHAHVTAVDGWSATAGEIIATANGVRFSTVNMLSACMRTSPELQNGFELTKSESISGAIQGFRSVQADKAFFYDRAGGNPRAAYVMKSDTVQVTGPEQSGFLPVQYVGNTATTKGFLKTADLAAMHAPVPHDTLRGNFEIKENDGISSGFEVITSDNRDMLFNLIAVNKFGGQNNGDIEMGHAKLVGDTATYQGDGCTITFAFSSDAKSVKVNQDGACGDFGANVVVSGDYDRK